MFDFLTMLSTWNSVESRLRRDNAGYTQAVSSELIHHLLHHLPVSSIHISTLCSRMEIMHFLYGDLKKKQKKKQLYKFIYNYIKWNKPLPKHGSWIKKYLCWASTAWAKTCSYNAINCFCTEVKREQTKHQSSYLCWKTLSQEHFAYIWLHIRSKCHLTLCHNLTQKGDGELVLQQAEKAQYRSYSRKQIAHQLT